MAFRIDWKDPEINQDPDFCKISCSPARQTNRSGQAPGAAEGDEGHTEIKDFFINNIVEGFATSPEGI